MEQTILESIKEGFIMLLSYFNWIYIFVVIVFTWLFNELVDGPKFKWLNWMQRLPRIWRTLLLGVLLMPLFAYFLRLDVREDYYGLFLSLIGSTIVYKIGLEKVLSWLGLKMFNKKPEDLPK